MKSVADELRQEQNAAMQALTPGERVQLALALGRRDLELYMAAHDVDRETAMKAFRRSSRAGRRPSRCADEPDTPVDVAVDEP